MPEGGLPFPRTPMGAPKPLADRGKTLFYTTRDCSASWVAHLGYDGTARALESAISRILP